MSNPPPILAQADFEYLRTLAQEKAAIVIDSDKMYLVEARLIPLARKAGFVSVGELFKALRARPVGELQRKVIEAMTINETSFFRDWRPFEALRKQLIPDLIARGSASKQLNIWSGACSTGQEPYSLAMVLREHPGLAGWKVRIVASDLSWEMVERAKTGRYTQLEVNRGLPAPMLLKYFVREGTDWCARPEIKQMVEFLPVNLATAWPPLPRLDVVFMRNVMIYFDVPTKKTILRNVRSLLNPNGYLILGAAETVVNLDSSFVRVDAEGACCYRAV